MNNSGAEIQSQHLTHTMQCLQTDIQTTPARKSNDLRASVSPKQRMCDGFIDCSNGEVSRSCFCHSGSQGLTHVLNSIVSYKSCRFSYIVYSIIKTLTTWQYWSKCLPCGRMSLCSCVALTSAGRRMSGVCEPLCINTRESYCYYCQCRPCRIQTRQEVQLWRWGLPGLSLSLYGLSS